MPAGGGAEALAGDGGWIPRASALVIDAAARERADAFARRVDEAAREARASPLVLAPALLVGENERGQNLGPGGGSAARGSAAGRVDRAGGAPPGAGAPEDAGRDVGPADEARGSGPRARTFRAPRAHYNPGLPGALLLEPRADGAPSRNWAVRVELDPRREAPAFFVLVLARADGPGEAAPPRVVARAALDFALADAGVGARPDATAKLGASSPPGPGWDASYAEVRRAVARALRAAARQASRLRLQRGLAGAGSGAGALPKELLPSPDADAEGGRAGSGPPALASLAWRQELVRIAGSEDVAEADVRWGVVRGVARVDAPAGEIVLRLVVDAEALGPRAGGGVAATLRVALAGGPTRPAARARLVLRGRAAGTPRTVACGLWADAEAAGAAFRRAFLRRLRALAPALGELLGAVGAAGPHFAQGGARACALAAALAAVDLDLADGGADRARLVDLRVAASGPARVRLLAVTAADASRRETRRARFALEASCRGPAALLLDGDAGDGAGSGSPAVAAERVLARIYARA
jgi:hypothetical protein